MSTITPMNKVMVVGLGYIGLPTAAVLASRKISVVGVDINPQAVNTINQGKIHIIEPDLEEVVQSAVSNGFLRATLQPEAADVFLIAVPTPLDANKKPDLSYIQNAAKSIAPVLQKGNLVILESTSPVGTTEQLAVWLAEACPHLSFPATEGEESDIRIAYCPERVLPGQVLRELVENDRVIGGMTPRCSSLAVTFYQRMTKGKCVVTNARTAEMCKLTENSFRDVNIAFANELSMLCASLDINVWELIQLANLHPRVSILQPGPGVGGHCIAVDPWFIVDKSPHEARIIRCAREVNDSKMIWVQTRIAHAVQSVLNMQPQKSKDDVVMVFFGLTFKANTDDTRESPALHIVNHAVLTHTGPIHVIEPNLTQLPASLQAKVNFCQNIDKNTLKEADLLVFLVDHAAFLDFDFSPYKNKTILDLKGITC